MISVEKALDLVISHGEKGAIKTFPLQESLGYVLASNIYSPIDMPPFRQSSMDGYAFKHSQVDTYEIVGEVKAGGRPDGTLREGQAYRIFTGACLPDGADTVVMQEHTTRNENRLTIEKMPSKAANVRVQGEQIRKGELGLEMGMVMNERAIGFLSSLGLTHIEVYDKPRIGILVTGNELVSPGESLEDGQVYESNSITLKTALQQAGIQDIYMHKVKDDLDATTLIIKELSTKVDVLLISGGISVGDYDFVQPALQANGVKEVFYKVNQKPGKPLWFGKKDRLAVFALPGNPASSLTCFYLYALPYLKSWMHQPKIHLERGIGILNQDVKNRFGKKLFLKAHIDGSRVNPLKGQASSMLKSFALSNALIVIPADKELIFKGEEVTYIKL